MPPDAVALGEDNVVETIPQLGREFTIRLRLYLEKKPGDSNIIRIVTSSGMLIFEMRINGQRKPEVGFVENGEERYVSVKIKKRVWIDVVIRRTSDQQFIIKVGGSRIVKFKVNNPQTFLNVQIFASFGSKFVPGYISGITIKAPQNQEEEEVVTIDNQEEEGKLHRY